MLIQTISEKIPIDETIKGLEFIEHERNLSKLKSYMDALMPFGEQTVVKYRNKFIQRFVETEEDQIIYTPLIQFINKMSSYQTKKEFLLITLVI